MPYLSENTMHDEWNVMIKARENENEWLNFVFDETYRFSRKYMYACENVDNFVFDETSCFGRNFCCFEISCFGWKAMYEVMRVFDENFPFRRKSYAWNFMIDACRGENEWLDFICS